MLEYPGSSQAVFCGVQFYFHGPGVESWICQQFPCWCVQTCRATLTWDSLGLMEKETNSPTRGACHQIAKTIWNSNNKKMGCVLEIRSIKCYGAKTKGIWPFQGTMNGFLWDGESSKHYLGNRILPWPKGWHVWRVYSRKRALESRSRGWPKRQTTKPPTPRVPSYASRQLSSLLLSVTMAASSLNLFPCFCQYSPYKWKSGPRGIFTGKN